MHGFIYPVENSSVPFHYRPVAAIYAPAPAAEGGPLPCFGGVGTGGVEGVQFIKFRQGYSFYLVLNSGPAALDAPYMPFADLMNEVKAGFGRTMSHLPAVFGVSRQTLYNWLAGELPKEKHQNKIVQLAAAANVFVETGFQPTSLALDRTVVQGKSFIELIGEGANGRETALRLVQIVKRGAASRVKLDALLGDRVLEHPDSSGMGRPLLNENI